MSATERHSRLEHVRLTTSQAELDALRARMNITEADPQRKRLDEQDARQEWLLTTIRANPFDILRALGFEVCVTCGRPVACGGHE